jgi:hypothetical protein
MGALIAGLAIGAGALLLYTARNPERAVIIAFWVAAAITGLMAP